MGATRPAYYSLDSWPRCWCVAEQCREFINQSGSEQDQTISAYIQLQERHLRDLCQDMFANIHSQRRLSGGGVLNIRF